MDVDGFADPFPPCPPPETLLCHGLVLNHHQHLGSGAYSSMVQALSHQHAGRHQPRA